MRLEITLPKQIVLDDYHDFYSVQQHYNLISPKIRVKEIGFYGGRYIGIIFEFGTLHEPDCQTMIKQIRKDTKAALEEEGTLK